MKINNINKKLFATAISFTMITTNICGCGKNNIYELSEHGDTITYHDLQGRYSIIELEILGENKIFFAKKITTFDNYYSKTEYSKYYDAFNDGLICKVERNNASIEITDSSATFVSETDIKDYLLYYDMIQEEYTREELENLFSKIKEEKNENKEKKLVK